jgi:hypothetical protein
MGTQAQLRLVETPKAPRPRRARAVAAGERRPWVLDAQTVRIGRRGIADARQALEAAARTDPENPLSKAS